MQPQDLGIGALFESVRDAVIVAETKTGRVVLWNPAATKIFGYSSSEALELRIDALVPERFKAQHEAGISRYNETGHGPYIDSDALLDLPALRKGGEEIRIEMTLSPISHLKNGRTDGRFVLAIVRDVTERKRAEEELRQLSENLERRVAERTAQLETERARLEAVLRQMPSGVAIAEAPSGRLVLANERLRQIWRHPFPPAAGPERYRQYKGLHPDGRPYQPEEWPLMRSISAGEVVTAEEIDILRGDGTTGTVRVSSSPIRERDGRIVAGVAILYDITERKRAERALRERARQQAAVAELGQRALGNADLSALMDEAVALVAQNLEVEYAKVLELLPEGDALLLRAGVGWKEGLVGHGTVGAGAESQAGYTLLSGEPVIVEDLRVERRFSGPPLLHEHGVVSGMSVVIQGQERPYGVLGAHTRERRTFTQDDVNFLQAVANVLATAIERKRAEEALRASEERFRATFEQAAVGIAHTVAPDGRWLRINKKLCDIIGYTQEELLGRTFDEITHPDDLDANREHVRRLLAGEVGTFSMEKRYIRKDGSAVWTNLTASLVREASSGEPKYFIAVIEDISDRKQIENALRESEERFRLIAENARDLISMTDMEGRYTYVSPSHEAVLGYAAEALLGTDFSDLIHPDDLAQLADRKNATRFQFRSRRIDGAWVWMEGSSYTVTWHDEPYVVAIARDITERKQAEEEIRQLNEELEQRVRERTAQLEEKSATLNTILDGLTEGVMATDRRGKPVFANPTARAMLGVDTEELPEELPDPWRDFRLPEVVARCALDGKHRQARVSSGETYVLVNVEYLPDFDDHRGGVLVMIQDLSESRRLEENQQRFLINAAHEFKTPISVVLGAAELLLTGDEEDPETRHRFLSHILTEGHRLKRLSDTMLRLARVGTDLREPELEVMGLGFIQEIAERTRPLAQSAGVTLHLENRGGRVRADREWVEQVLLGVISNAIKYSDRGGHVWLRAEGGTMVVEDEGIGISEDDLPHVFERFYRGGGGPGEEGGAGGFGLGLPICKDLVERMGGKISIHSEEGVGTSVKIELPEVS